MNVACCDWCNQCMDSGYCHCDDLKAKVRRLEEKLENERMQRTLLTSSDIIALRDQVLEEAAVVAEKSYAFGGSLIAFELRARKKGPK